MNHSSSAQPTSSNSAHSYPNDEYPNDEIDLRQIGQNIWQIRWKIILFFTLFLSIGLIFFGINYYSNQQNRPLSYSINLENIVNERYPNGTQFTLSHLLLPQVINKTLDELQLTDMTSEEVREAVQIIYSNPDINLLQRQFFALAEEREKDIEAIKRLQEAMNQKRGEKSALQITLTDNIDIPNTKRSLFLITLVENWSNHFIREGVLSKYTLEPLPSFDVETFQPTPLSIINFTHYTLQTKNALQALINANNETQYFHDMRAFEAMETELNNIQNIYLQQLALILNIDKDSIVNQLKNNLKLRSLNQTLVGLEKSLEDIRQLVASASHNQVTDILNINKNQSAISQDIIALGKKVGLTETYNDLLNRKLQLETSIAELNNNESNISNFTSILLNLQQNTLNQAFVTDYQSVLKQYVITADKISVKIRQYTDHFTNPNIQRLYSQSTQPIYLEADFSAKKQLLIILGITLLLSLITMVILLMIHAYRHRD